MKKKAKKLSGFEAGTGLLGKLEDLCFSSELSTHKLVDVVSDMRAAAGLHPCMSRGHTWDDIVNYKEPQLLIVDKRTVEFVESGGYWIGWERIDTPMKLVVWVDHLVGKPWMSAMMMKQFIEAVCEKHKFVWEQV